MGLYQKIIKALIDKVAAVLAIVILLPITALIIILQLIIYKSNPFFFQSRPGKGGKIFKLIKFRTMSEKKDNQGHLLTDQERVTALGSFLRSTSLDELPQLINVIKGEMSLVGPRPLLTEYLILYNAYQRKRHEVKPGITGWAQVNGRDKISWEQKFDLDIWYTKNISFSLDIKILFRTIKVLLQPKSLKNGQKQVVKFKGSNLQNRI